MGELKHIISEGNNDAVFPIILSHFRMASQCRKNSQLGSLGLRLDVISDNRDVFEIKCCIDLVHEVKGSRLEHVNTRLHSVVGVGNFTLKTCSANTRARDANV